MTLQEAVMAALSGGSPSLRVAYIERPAAWGTADGVTFQFVSEGDDEHLTGDSNYTTARIQVDAWSLNSLNAEAMMLQARALLRNSTLLSANTVGGFGDRDADTLLFRRSKDYSISFTS